MVTAPPAPPGVLSLHALPADHHEGPWDHVTTPPGLKRRLLAQALLTLVHGRRLATLAGLPHGLIVLVDEVEAFAVARSAASFATNPVDVHRATDAVLAGIDAIAADAPTVLFLATTNFLAGVDEAFLSRADLVVTFDLPDPATIERILRHSLAELAVQWPAIKALVDDQELHRRVAGRCAGWDGRCVRKLALAALAQRAEVARDPGLLTAEDLLAAAGNPGPGVPVSADAPGLSVAPDAAAAVGGI